MVGNPYSSMKILKHLDRIECAMNGMMKPVFLQVDLTNKCNFNCCHCSSKMYADYVEYNKAEHNVEQIFLTLNEAEEMGVKAIEVTGGGEPTLHPSFVNIMRAIRERFEFALVTNGTRLDNAEIQECLVGASWVRLSIDSYGASMHSRVHGINERILSPILRNASRFKEKSPSTVLGFSFVVTNDNIEEIVKSTRIAKAFGFDNIRFSSFYSPKGPMIREENRERVNELLEEVKRDENNDFKVFTFSERVKEIYEEKKTELCYYASVVGIISATGKVYPCCAMKNMAEHCIGDIHEDSLQSIYARQSIRTTESCPPCWMMKKNEIAEYVINDQLHTNFP